MTPLYPPPPLNFVCGSIKQFTHGVKVVKDLMHPDDLVIQLIVAVRIGQEGVTISDEEVEYVYNLQNIHCHYVNAHYIHTLVHEFPDFINPIVGLCKQEVHYLVD